MRPPLFDPRGWWLCMPMILFGLLDAGLTLAGQSEAYWSGNYADVNELSPSLRHWLEVGPWAFVAGIAGWLAMACALVLLLPEMLALFLAVAVVLGHTMGAGSWILWRYPYGYQAGTLLILLAAVAIVFAFKRGQSSDGSAAIAWRHTHLPGWLRWVVIAMLAAGSTWLYLVPR